MTCRRRCTTPSPPSSDGRRIGRADHQGSRRVPASPTDPAPAARPTCLVVGEALVDVVVGPDGVRRERPGGSPANVAVGLARSGHPTSLLTSYGRDRFGDLIDRHLTAAGVQVLRHDRPTSSAIATIDATGAAHYDFDLRWELGDHAVPLVDLVHTGSVAAVLEPGADAVRRLVAAARRHATVSYDVNARPDLTGPPEQARAAVSAVAALADVVKASDEDLAWLFPSADHDPEHGLEAAAAHWLAASAPTQCRAVVVTRGAGGATALTPQLRVDVPAPTVEVVDTIGAGDAFMAGMLGALLDRSVMGAARRDGLGALDHAAWADVLGHGVRSAAAAVARAGAT